MAKTKQAQWECVLKHESTGFEGLHRVAVPGGWLYAIAPGDYRSVMTFVPDAERNLSRCDECGESDDTVRYVDNAKRTANVCRTCAP